MNYKLVPDQTKYKKKHLFYLKIFLNLSLPEGAAAVSINDFINAMKKKTKKQRNKLIVLH